MIILDEELANSLFGSAQDALNQIIEVNEISYRVIGVYASKEAKAVKAFGVGGLPIMTNISLAANFNTDEISNIVFRVNDTSLTQTLGPELARRMTEIAGLQPRGVSDSRCNGSLQRSATNVRLHNNDY